MNTTGDILIDNTSTLSFQTYKTFFMRKWSDCVRQGWAAKDAREFAQLEWEQYLIKDKVINNNE